MYDRFETSDTTYPYAVRVDDGEGSVNVQTFETEQAREAYIDFHQRMTVLRQERRERLARQGIMIDPVNQLAHQRDGGL